MRNVSNRFLLLAPAALALTAFLSLRATPEAAADDKPAVRVGSLSQTYECTAIGEVIKANGDKVPRNGTELMKALARVGDFAQLPVPFSAVALDSGLTHPRVLIAPRAGRALGESGFEDSEEPALPKLPFGVRPSRGQPIRPGVLPAQPADTNQPQLSPAKLTQSHLEGRLFLAANLEHEAGSTPKVKTIEFISWNTSKKRFEFGVIDFSPTDPEIQILDGVRCFVCHKNKGPILGQGPWSNTTNNDHVRAATLSAFNVAAKEEQPATGLGNPFGSVLGQGQRTPLVTAEQRQKTTFDGMSLVVGEPEVCDFAIRTGGEIARDREIYLSLAKTADGRKAMVLLLSAIATPQPPAEVARQIDLTFNTTDANFINNFVSLSKSMSNTLFDFSASGSIGTLRTITTNQPTGWGGGSTQRTDTIVTFSGNPQTITEYDTKRAGGEPGMPSNRLPSNPRSYIRPTIPVPPRPSAAMNPVNLARMIGISTGDREFMAKQLSEAAQSINNPKVSPVTLSREVFNTPTFQDMFKAGDIPDREDFKDRFVQALTAVAKANKIEGPKLNRGDYASGPNCAPGPGHLVKEPVVAPSTACRGCHDIRGVAKQSAFNPIPMLAFDPFDKQARDNWVQSNDAKKRQAVLARMLQRLVTDKDMPPEDSAEYTQFRQKDQASFDALKDWLESELKKAKGN